MKRKLRNLTAMGFILASTFQIHAQGYIVPNGVTYVGYSDIFSGYLMNVIQNPTNSDYTGFALSPVGKTPPTSLYTNTFSLVFMLMKVFAFFWCQQTTRLVYSQSCR